MDDLRHKACVILTSNDDGTFEVMDALGRVHKAENVPDLGHVCASILSAEDLPEVSKATPVQVHVESAADKTAEILAKNANSKIRAIAPLIAPVVKGVTSGVSRFRRREKANSQQEDRDAKVRHDRQAQRKRLIATRGS